MFKTLLIANRGEIACRIIATARRLGIACVAVYSDADRNARHVRLADAAVHLGGAAAADSYLAVDRLLDACARMDVDAVHPGYGFLSENAAAAEAFTAAGVVFVGPPAAAIRAMGDKAEAKKRMEIAAVPVTPGYHGDDMSLTTLSAAAATIGYPVLIKAAAGGGGKGMRRVDEPHQLSAAIAACQREAAASFGDSRLLIESYLVNPRHIEMQIVADQHGHCLHLFERDCSMQRRHQKVIEEAPAPRLSESLRQAMATAAIAAARAVGYVGAGTVEFIVGNDGRFYFMEMNTRLQVEHPVTELITGIDLVEWQLRIAAGEPLPRDQDAIVTSGHAIEARLYAEDAERDFLPAAGRVSHLLLPTASPHVRIDSGVDAGDEVSPYYDPMIAKLIVWDSDRPQAIARMRRALADLAIAGLTTNRDFLGRLVGHRRFVEAELSTNLINEESESLTPRRPTPTMVIVAAVVAEIILAQRSIDAARVECEVDRWSPWAVGDAWRLNLPAVQVFCVDDGEVKLAVSVRQRTSGYTMTFGEQRFDEVVWREEAAPPSWLCFALVNDGVQQSVRVAVAPDRLTVFVGESSHVLTRNSTPHHGAGDDHGDGGLHAPMSGKIVAVLVAVGDCVKRGDPLIVLEAMKMEHSITAPSDGEVVAIACVSGQQVSEGATLVELGEASADEALAND